MSSPSFPRSQPRNARTQTTSCQEHVHPATRIPHTQKPLTETVTGMRLTKPTRSHRFGRLRIFEEISVTNLDGESGPLTTVSQDDHLHAPPKRRRRGYDQDGDEDREGVEDEDRDHDGHQESETVYRSPETLSRVLEQMVIIVPCKNESVDVIRGVISAIPPSCRVILVSNCERGGPGVDDQYMQQVKMLKTLQVELHGCNLHMKQRQMLAIHQKDIHAAEAFRISGLPELLDPANGTIRDGKGEGMLLGVAIAAALFPRHRYVGFIDADNLLPQSVDEYCKAYAAGLSLGPPPEQEHTMVRLRWASKPKRVPGTTRYVHVTEGRCSRVVNKWLSKLFASIRDEHQYHYTTVHGGAIKIPPTTCSSAPVSGLVSTANAGEHAMTMGLALKLRMAAGYAVEPFHFVDLLERSGFAYYSGADLKESKGLLTDYAGEKRGSGAARPLNKPTRILQIRTLSPHFHRESDEGHIRRMWAVGLGAIYHNLVPVGHRAVSELREGMHKFAKENGGLDARTGKLPEPRIYRPLEEMNMERFRQMLGESLRDGTLRRFGFGRNMNGDEPICTCHT